VVAEDRRVVLMKEILKAAVWVLVGIGVAIGAMYVFVKGFVEGF
jgi:hypothetical protein